MTHRARIYAMLIQTAVLLLACTFIMGRKASASKLLPALPAPLSQPPEAAQAAMVVSLPPAAAPKPAAPRFKSKQIDITDTQFFVRKFMAEPRYDCVIGGDSRMLVGVSPGEMKNTFPDLRIYNFAFRANAWTPDYVRALHDVLDPASKDKRIVLGISPLGLTPFHAKDNGYQTVKKMHPADRFRIMTMDKELAIFRPFMDAEAENSGITYYYHDDGWVAADRPVTREKIRKIKEKSRGAFVAPRVVENLMREIRSWTAEGIKVYAFRLPTSLEMETLENEQSRFDEAEFTRQVREAGARWLVIDRSGYKWNDGHHLDIPSSIVFSDRLAKAMAAADGNGTPPDLSLAQRTKP
jgi:hypothetical protein